MNVQETTEIRDLTEDKLKPVAGGICGHLAAAMVAGAVSGAEEAAGGIHPLPCAGGPKCCQRCYEADEGPPQSSALSFVPS